MREYRIYAIVLLILTGGLFLDMIPNSSLSLIDNPISRPIGFLIVALIGSTVGLPEAILFATILGLIINKSHDIMFNSKLQKHITQRGVVEGDGGGVMADVSPTYTSKVATRLGLIPLESYRSRMENMLSYQLH